MKITEYTASQVQTAEEKRAELYSEKLDDYELPEFSKEVPVSSKKSQKGATVTVDYDWNKTDTPSIKIKKIDFNNNESLEGLYRVAARDGADSISFKYNSVTYILRKTTREIAHALFDTYRNVKGAVEGVLGYLRTVSGTYYIISKACHSAWAFDRRIAKGDINYLDVDSLDQKAKSRLVELICEKLADLHYTNTILGRFTLNNVLLCGEDMVLSDLRRARDSRKRAFVVEEFVNALQYLFAIGVAGREDVYQSIAYYATKNDKSCEEWYTEKKGNKPSDSFDMVTSIEEEIYG
jgi:hypothetical protein